MTEPEKTTKVDAFLRDIEVEYVSGATELITREELLSRYQQFMENDNDVVTFRYIEPDATTEAGASTPVDEPVDDAPVDTHEGDTSDLAGGTLPST